MNRERIGRCVDALEERGWAGALATPGVNFSHLTGAEVDRSERLVCLGLPREGGAWLVCPAFEADRLGPAVGEVELLAWEESEDPFALAAERIGPGTWAVEPTTAYHDAARLADAAPEARLADGAEVFESLRRRKDEGEIEALRGAAAASWEVFDEVVAGLAAGVTEAAVAARIEAAFAARGLDDGWALVQFGPSAALPHGEPGERPLEPGSPVLIDWGAWLDGYASDLTRTFWWDGAPAPEETAPEAFRRVLDVVRDAHRAAIERAGPGVPCEDVDAAARETIAAAGFGEFFLHRTGHGLGRELHEPPYLVAGNGEPLLEGDVVTIEPGIYLAGRFGARWEDDVRITAGGVEVLSERGGAA